MADTEQQAHPVVLTPDDPSDIRRLAAALRAADRQRLIQANENWRSDIRGMAEQRDEWVARAVRADDGLTRVCAQLREIADEHRAIDG